MKRLHKYAFPLFLAPEVPGSGSAAALATPIQPPEVNSGAGGGGGGPGEIDIAAYTPPPVDFDNLGGDPPSTPEPKPPAKPAAPAPEPKPADPKPDKKEIPVDAPAALMRNRIKELEELNERTRTDLETQLAAAKSDRRVDELTKKLEENARQASEIEKRAADLETKLMVHNPLIAKEVNALVDKFNSEWEDVVQAVPTLRPVYRSLLDEFRDLPHGKPEYAEKLGEFRGRLKEMFGDDQSYVFDSIRKGLKFRADHERLVGDVHKNAVQKVHEAEVTEWKTKMDDYDSNFEKYFEPPADAVDKDPLNALLFMRNFEAGLPKEEVGKVNSNIRLFVGRVLNGAQPRRREDFPELDDQAAAVEMQRINNAVKEDRQKAGKLFSNALKWFMYSRPLIAELTKQQAARKSSREALPSDPTGVPGAEPGSGFDLATYAPPPVPSASAFE